MQTVGNMNRRIAGRGGVFDPIWQYDGSNGQCHSGKKHPERNAVDYASHDHDFWLSAGEDDPNEGSKD